MYTFKKIGYHTVRSDPNISSSSSFSSAANHNEFIARNSCVSAFDPAIEGGGLSPMMMSSWNQPSPFAKTPWTNFSGVAQTSLIGSLVREEGHIYSLAAKDKILYTGSNSKNICVWKNMQEFSAFKSNSGLVKAIIISGDQIFIGHQDGKICVWKISPKSPNVHKRIGTMSTFFDIF